MMMKLNKFLVAFKCRFPAKAVAWQLLVISSLTIGASAVVFFLSGMGDLTLDKFLTSNCIVVSFFYCLLLIGAYPHKRNVASRSPLETGDQIVERCRRHLHEIVMVAACSIAVITVIIVAWQVWLWLYLAFGFIDWVNR